MFLYRYLKRVSGPLSLGLMIGCFMLPLSFPTLIASLILVYGATVFLTSFSILKFFLPRPITPSIHLFLSSISGVVTLLSFIAFPHVFLFANAFPVAISLTAIVFSSFLMTFELALYWPTPTIPRGNLREFSLIRIFFSPLSSYRRLQALFAAEDLIAANANANRHAGQHNGEALIQQRRYIDALFEHIRNELATDPSQAASRIEGLKLPKDTPMGLDALTARQTAVLSKMPKGAIIDDMGVYKKELDLLCRGKTKRELNAKDRHQTTLKEHLEAQALKKTSEAVTLLEATYKSSLTPAQQDCYTKYREITRKLSPPFGACPISMEQLHNKTATDFVILEKRFMVNNTLRPVPGTSLFYKTSFKTSLSKDKEPMTNDTYSAPSTFPCDKKPGTPGYDASRAYKTEYRYHPCTIIHGHALSLELCQAMEEFLNPSLVDIRENQLRDKSNPITKKSRVPSGENSAQSPAAILPSSYRNTPPATNYGIANQNIYSSVANDIEDLTDLSEEELKFIYS